MKHLYSILNPNNFNENKKLNQKFTVYKKL